MAHQFTDDELKKMKVAFYSLPEATGKVINKTTRKQQLIQKYKRTQIAQENVVLNVFIILQIFGNMCFLVLLY